MQKFEEPAAMEHRTFGEHKTKWITISMDEYESMKAALEILSDPEAMRKMKKAEKESLEGKGKKLEDLKKELGL